MRSAVAYLSKKNLIHNVKVINQLASNSKLIAMVKANAYGHGIRSTALRLQNYVDSYGVASIDEALALRKAGILNQIVLMEGVFEPEEILIASKENFSIVFHNQQQIDWLDCYSSKHLISNPINSWMKIDTGMSRLGFNLQEAVNIYKYLSENSSIFAPIGVMSHFACSDYISHPLNMQQITNFNNFFHDILIKHGNYNAIKSFCNSGAIFNFPEQHYDVVRSGIALYGVSPVAGKTAKELNLKPVMTLQTKIIAIKNLSKNSSVGYGAKFVCKRDTKAAIIAIGYGDGYPRNSIDGTPVVVNNKICKTIGAISMDMATIDITDCLDVKLGDQVVLWGEDLPIEQVASASETSVYDLLTSVQHRVKFFWN